MIDSAVAGARPAGLVVRAALDDLQIDHLVLNADGSDRAGVHSAGTRLRLNNPEWMNPMLGPHKLDTCPAAAEVSTATARKIDRARSSYGLAMVNV